MVAGSGHTMTKLRSRLLLLVVLLVWGCGKEPTATHQQLGSLALQFEFVSQQGEGTGDLSPSKVEVDSLSVAVSGSGMDPIRKVFPVTGGIADGRVDGIPAGSERYVDVLAWSVDPDSDLYQGIDTVTIEAGKVTEATLTMTRLQNDLLALLTLRPESTYVDSPVIADASASVDYYFPDSEIEFRFLLNGSETKPWGGGPVDTIFPAEKGSLIVTVEIRNDSGSTGSAQSALVVLNRPPDEPGTPFPAVGDTLLSLSPVLSWVTADPEDDPLSHHVWLGEDSTAVSDQEAPAQMMESEVESLQVGPLTPDTVYYWKVVVLDGADQTQGEVWRFYVSSAPLIVEPGTVALPCSQDSAEVTLINLTGSAVDWVAEWDAEWLTLDPSSGTVWRSPQSLLLIANTRSGYLPGVETTSITFRAGDFSIDLVASLEISPELSSPFPLPDSLMLFEPDFLRSISFSNSGCGDLIWELDAVEGDWITVSPENGVVLEGETGGFEVSADISGLASGRYVGRVDFAAVDSLYSINIVLDIPTVSCLDVIPDSILLGPEVFSGTVSLANCGNIFVTWNAQWLGSWLTLNPTSGILDPNQSVQVQISAANDALPSGEFDALVDFAGSDSTAILNVHVVVPGDPSLFLTPRQVTIPADTDSASFDVQNTGTGNLLWYVSDLPLWCETMPTGGLLLEGERESVLVSVDRSHMEPGVLPGDVQISSNGGDDTLRVILEVGAPGCSDPIYYEDFNGGVAPGWVPSQGFGTWNVVNGRYVVSGIPQSTEAWSEHQVVHSGPSRTQADVRFENSANETGIAAVYLKVRPTFTLEIDGAICNAVGVGVRRDGLVFMLAREIATNEWFPFGITGQGDLFYPTEWNTLAIVVDGSQFRALLNGAVEVTIPGAGGAPPMAGIGLLASELDMMRFDRVSVCPE